MKNSLKEKIDPTLKGDTASQNKKGKSMSQSTYFSRSTGCFTPSWISIFDPNFEDKKGIATISSTHLLWFASSILASQIFSLSSPSPS